MENDKAPETPIEPDFAKFAEEADARDVAEKLGTKPPEKKAEEVKAKAEPEKVVEIVHKEERSIHRLTPGQLRAKVRELEAENRGLKVGRQPESEVVEQPKAEEPKVLRARPKPEDLDNGQPKYKTWEAYEDDLLDWNRERIFSELDERSTKKTQETQIEQVNKAIESSWNERVEKARVAHPEDFDDALQSEIVKLIQPGSIVDEWVLDSELGAELLYFFHHNPAEFKKFENIKGPTPGARRATARRMLVAIEGKLAPAEKVADGEEIIELTEKPKPAKEESRISKTPPPSREVGGRGAAPTDRARAAVANDDTGSYIDEMNRREIAEKFGRR